MATHALTVMPRLVNAALIAFANNMRDMFRRMDDRRCLFGLSALERRDIGLHRAHSELSKWPWQP